MWGMITCVMGTTGEENEKTFKEIMDYKFTEKHGLTHPRSTTVQAE